MPWAEAILVAVSLCADCFACTLCSGVTMRRGGLRQVAWIALVFAVIQTGLLCAGWAFGSLFVGWISTVSHWVGFLLLLYVGGGMFLEGVRGLRGCSEAERVRLDGLRNVILGGLATSIDALGVGVAQSMSEQTASFGAFAPLAVSVAVVTALSVVAGLSGGRVIGQRFGHWAEVAGGLVLVGIGAGFLF